MFQHKCKLLPFTLHLRPQAFGIKITLVFFIQFLYVASTLAIYHICFFTFSTRNESIQMLKLFISPDSSNNAFKDKDLEH